MDLPVAAVAACGRRCVRACREVPPGTLTSGNVEHLAAGAREPGGASGLYAPQVPFTATILQVLIASPGDVQDARDAVERAIHAWNVSVGQREKVVFLPRRWETDAIPQLSGDAQSVINTQLVDEADVVVGIFHSRLGRPTSRAVSGTAEELERSRRAGKPVHVYFGAMPYPYPIDARQLTLVQEFQATLDGLGLLGRYTSLPDLEARIRNALDHDARQLVSQQVPRSAAPPAPPEHDPVIFSEHELAIKTNTRFGFSFKYPRTWAREDPENGDGYRFVHPTVPGVRLSAYGSFGSHSNLWDEMRQRRQWAEEQGATFAVDRQADSDVYMTDGTSFDAPGWLQRREQTHDEVGRITAITRAVWAPGRYVIIEAQAPSVDFPRYEQALDLLTASLRVTRESSDHVPGL